MRTIHGRKRQNLQNSTILDETENPLLDSQTSPRQRRVKQIWAIGGGKGGVGKSLLASSLAISLSRAGHKVIAVDLDLGGANLHTALGVGLPKQTLSDFINTVDSNIQDCVVPSGIPRLDLISGAHDSIGIANINSTQKNHLLNHLKLLDADYLVFDLGAGTSANTIDFFLYSDIGIITLLPEPTSIENGYRFIKSAYYQYLLNSPHLSNIRPLIKMAMETKNPLGIKSPTDLFREVNKSSPESAMKLKKAIEDFKLNLVVNETRTQTDIEIGNSIKTVCKKYFGMDIDYIGHLDYDSSVWQAVRRKRPLLLEFPNSKLASGIEHIMQNIIRHNALFNPHFLPLETNTPG